MILALLPLAFGSLRFISSIGPGLAFPEAGLHITDAASFGQVAASLGNGRIYGPPEEGVGHIYGPLTTTVTLVLHRCLGLRPSPPSVRILGQVLFLAACVLLILALRQLWPLPWSFLVLLALAGVCGQILLGSFGSVYTADLRLFLISLLLFLSGSSWRAAPAAAVLCVACLGLGSPNFLASGLVLFPLWLERPAARRGMLLAAGISVLLLLWAYAPPLRYYWCIGLPLSEPRRALLPWILRALHPIHRYPYGASGCIGLGLLLFAAGRPSKAFWLAAGLLLACVPPALKPGGGEGNLAPFAWIAWSAGLACAYSASRPGAMAAALVSVWTVANPSIPMIKGQEAARQPTLRDRQNQALLEGALDQARSLGWTVWADSAPAYFAARALPYRFDVTHMWEQWVAGDLRSVDALKAALRRKDFDIVAVHGEPGGGPAATPLSRCTGPETFEILKQNYHLVGVLPRDPAGDPGIGDLRFNGSVGIYASQNEKARALRRLLFSLRPPAD